MFFLYLFVTKIFWEWTGFGQNSFVMKKFSGYQKESDQIADQLGSTDGR